MVGNLESRVKFTTIQDINFLNFLRLWVVVSLRHITKVVHPNMWDDFCFCKE